MFFVCCVVQVLPAPECLTDAVEELDMQLELELIKQTLGSFGAKGVSLRDFRGKFFILFNSYFNFIINFFLLIRDVLCCSWEARGLLSRTDFNNGTRNSRR